MPSGILVDRWFDGDRFRADPATIRIQGSSIVSIVDRHVEEPGMVDARGKLVLPGLVNAHAHVARAGFFEADEPPFQFQQIVMNFQGALRSGVTTVADMGCTIPMMRALQRLTDLDPLAGPRFVGAGPILTAPEGYPFDWVSPLWRHSEAVLAVEDEDDARRAVARTVEGGMHHIKVAIMHESFARSPLPALSPRAARAVVAEARAQGRRVFAHAHGNEDYRVALDAGVSALMHSSFEPLTPELVRRIRDAGVLVCPTLWAYDATCKVGECDLHRRPDLRRHATWLLRRSWDRFAEAYAASGEVFPDASTIPGVNKRAALEAMRIASANLRLLRDAGVPIAFGNDASFGVSLLSRPYDEIDAMAKSGLDVAACLRAATSSAADLLGRPELGRLRPGATADFIVAPASLETNLAALDVDLPGASLRVFTRGHEVPRTTDVGRVARIAAAYLEGTAATLGHTLRSWAGSRFRGNESRAV